MTGRRSAAVARGAAAALFALLLPLTGCADPGRPAPDRAGIQRLLDARAHALLARDEPGYLAALDPALVPAARTEFERLAPVPLADWSYRVTGVERTGPGRATARAELGYRIKGYDSGPVTGTRILDLADRGGRWYVTADRPTDGAPQQLWQQGAVRAVTGGHSLVLGVGQSPERLEEIAAAADRAVPAASGAWPSPWAGRIVVLVPASTDAMGRLLGAPASAYRGIAAVTTGEAGGGPKAPADRIIVNPEAYAGLGDFGRRFVLTHETTHVATRARTTAATPLWLSEGFADWAAYRGTGRTPTAAAPELAREIRAGKVPAALPDDKHFAFGGDADALARAYEGGWLACAMIADRWGAAELTAFYGAVGAHPGRAGAVEKALNDVLGITPEDFTARWRTYLTERLG
ncbi:hypothetical protein [Streptomyces laurentii]|uniref:hypothetical protein n=1 Tax=Streptomyces laurentii TaxID=39478 RepID=UPI00340F4DB8